ncbi:HU family DNA-binding protein [Streptomyces chartreusis]|uniref:HU family DNA-binding protein n=1 Tax=Streptomyces chartreusis TaxID=1969 RepID=UPI00380683F7
MKKKPTPITGRLTTTGLAEVVAADLGTTPKEAYETVATVFSAIVRANAAGHDVAITNFGTFISYRAKRSRRRNPQTDEPFTVPAHQKVRFRVSPQLAEAVRKRNRKATVHKAPKGTRTAAAE